MNDLFARFYNQIQSVCNKNSPMEYLAIHLCFNGIDEVKKEVLYRLSFEISPSESNPTS